MGINTLAYLPATVDLGNLALAIQRLTDADKVVLKPTGWGVHNDGVVAERSEEYAFDGFFDLEIVREEGFGDSVEGQVTTLHSGSIHLNTYHRDYSQPETDGEGRLVMFGTMIYGGNASAFWAALGTALVKFFGGTLDWNDCDSVYVNLQSKATPHAKITDGDRRWLRTRAAIQALEPVTGDHLWIWDGTPGIRDRFGHYRQEGSSR